MQRARFDFDVITDPVETRPQARPAAKSPPPPQPAPDSQGLDQSGQAAEPK